jgi:hypothetical protein
MAHFETVDGPTEDSFEAIVEVGLAQPLTPSSMVELLQALLQPLSGSLADRVFEGLTYLEITTSTLRTRFRFARTPSGSEVSREELENLARLRPQFLFYVFASLDRSFHLVDVPFPPDFRDFLSLPAELGLEE